MIVSRTPLRISFVGGGTDIREYYKKSEGAVLSTSIDKYIYVAVKHQLPFVDYKYRVNWSQAEFKNSVEEIENPIVREALKIFEIDFPIEITTFADVPAGTGLGSSSTFAVGLLHALYALKGEMVSKGELANQAAKIEIDLLKRYMGKQDHFAAAYGNLNVFRFFEDESTSVEPVLYKPEIKDEIQNRLLMFYTAQKRNASDILKKQIENTADKFEVLSKMKGLIPDLNKVFNDKNRMNVFGDILHEGWMLKKSISSNISNGPINDYYERAIKAGAIGGKLLGAGGGGFLPFYAEKHNHERIRAELRELYEMKFKFDDAGTRITYYDQRPF